MLGFIKNIFRKRALRRFGSNIETRILPLSEIKTAITFIDVEDSSFDICKNAIQAFYKENNIKGEIFFFDFRKINSEELLITNVQTTILKKDLNWIGKPSKDKIDLMLNSNPDLFISLIKGRSFPIEFMAKCSNAKFKVGRKQLSGDTFDLIISDTKGVDTSEAEVFQEVKKYITRIG